MTPEGVAVGGRSATASDAGLAEQITAEREAPTGYGEPARDWVLSIAADVPRARVASTLKALADSGHPRGHLLLATTQIGEIPAPRDPARLAALAGKLEGLDPSERAVFMAKEIQASMPACAGVQKAFSAVAAAAADQRCPLLAVGIAEGLVECGCPDADALLTQLYAMSLGMSRPERLAVTVPVVVDPEAPSRPGQTWGEVVGALDDAAAFTALWVGPS